MSPSEIAQSAAVVKGMFVLLPASPYLISPLCLSLGVCQTEPSALCMEISN